MQLTEVPCPRNDKPPPDHGLNPIERHDHLHGVWTAEWVHIRERLV